MWVDVPVDLRVAIMERRETGSYPLGSRHDTAQQMEIPASQGVKQGCVLAPTLWVLYTCFVFARLDQAIHAGWTADHVTAFADDLNFRWDFQNARDCERFLADIDKLLQVLADAGLRVIRRNPLARAARHTGTGLVEETHRPQGSTKGTAVLL